MRNVCIALLCILSILLLQEKEILVYIFFRRSTEAWYFCFVCQTGKFWQPNKEGQQQIRELPCVPACFDYFQFSQWRSLSRVCLGWTLTSARKSPTPRRVTLRRRPYRRDCSALAQTLPTVSSSHPFGLHRLVPYRFFRQTSRQTRNYYRAHSLTTEIHNYVFIYLSKYLKGPLGNGQLP